MIDPIEQEKLKLQKYALYLQVMSVIVSMTLVYFIAKKNIKENEVIKVIEED